MINLVYNNQQQVEEQNAKGQMSYQTALQLYTVKTCQAIFC